MVALTELDKTVLLAFLVSVKKQPGRFISEDSIVMKFPMRQRRNARTSIKRLIQSDILIRHTKENSYRLSENGLKTASKLLFEGAKLWAYLK